MHAHRPDKWGFNTPPPPPPAAAAAPTTTRKMADNFEDPSKKRRLDEDGTASTFAENTAESRKEKLETCLSLSTMSSCSSSF